MMKKVFLGGTCGTSTWRETLTPMLEIDYFNPIVDEWNDEAFQREVQAKKECNVFLYVITSQVDGFYSVAEVVDDSNKRPEMTIFCFDEADTGFTGAQIRSLRAIRKMIEENGARWFGNLDDVAAFLNGR